MRKLITTLGVGVILMIPTSPAAASEGVESGSVGAEGCYVEYELPRPPSVSTEFPFITLSPGGPPSLHVYCPILDEDPPS